MSKRPDVLLLITCLLSSMTHYTAAQHEAPALLNPKVCQEGNVTKGCITQEGALYAHVLHSYNSLLPPPGDVTNVEFNYFILKIIGVDERNKVLSTRGWLTLKWTDIRLQWKPDEFGGVTSLVLPVDRVWTPVIAIINRVGGHNDSVYYAGAHVYVTNTGELSFMPGVLLQTYCDIDLFSFPFDSQWCHILISPSGALAKKSRTRLRLRNNAHFIDISGRQYIESTEWDVNFAKIIQHPTEQVFEFDNITQVVIRLELHRRGTYHRAVLFYPACILAVALTCVFLLPPASQEKIMLGGVIFLGYLILLGLLGSFLPDDMHTLPLIGKACLFSLFMAALSLVLASVVSSMHRREAKLKPMSPWLHTVLLRYLAKFVCVNKSEATAIGEGYDSTALTFRRDSESVAMNSEIDNNSNADIFRLILRELQLAANPELEKTHFELKDVAIVQWRLGAKVLDRLLFVVYCIAMPIYIGLLLTAHAYGA